MKGSDQHLERALKEYNQKISDLEAGEGSNEEMLEALVNRSTILLLMESFTSSMEDSEDAMRLASIMESKGEHVDTGTYIKMYENHGQLLYENDNDGMAEDYGKILPKLDEVNPVNVRVRHYDDRGLIIMCENCAEDLIDASKLEMATQFLRKALVIIGRSRAMWYRNRKVSILYLIGQTENDMGLKKEALKTLKECVRIGTKMVYDYSLDDYTDVVNADILRGDILESMGDLEGMWAAHEQAAVLLESLYADKRIDDAELLINLHQGIATSMMNAGRIELAEKHLLRAIRLGIPGMKEAMDEIADRYDLN